MALNFPNVYGSSNAVYLSVDDTESLDITGALTLIAFTKNNGLRSDTGNNVGVISKFVSTINQRSYILYCAGATTNAKAAGGVSSNGTLGTFAEDTTTSLGTVWRHMAMVYVPSVSITTYLDGVQVAQNTTSIPSVIYNSTVDVRIGNFAVLSGTNSFSGDIACPAIYSAALTDTEIASLAKGFNPRRIRPQSLVFYAPLLRNLQDLRQGLALTAVNSPTVANHPRVY